MFEILATKLNKNGMLIPKFAQSSFSIPCLCNSCVYYAADISVRNVAHWFRVAGHTLPLQIFLDTCVSFQGTLDKFFQTTG